MKKNPITIGIDDARFELNAKEKYTPLIGVVCQGLRVVNVLREKVTIDGNDATNALIKLIRKTDKLVQYVLTDTITFAGFNIADLQEVYKTTKKPIIAITEREVNLDTVKIALQKKFPKKYKNKFQNIVNAGNLYQTSIKTAGGLSNVYFHMIGIPISEVEELLKILCIDSKMPEPIRIAHIIGRIF
ncbi:MAG: DUF99 family protein [Candidatus Lokiarchaeota archaeon]|nr:DUF99 family protein [Candidatus Lokiarchaeota archaeon]MBD3339245.1 DUF99 family protein [Candidatus Lokiarchaeota archaeon]